MTDYFALLQQPRRPWLDAAAIKEAYLRLSKEVRKSPQPEGASADINAAYQCLRTPRTRILHLIELETGQHPETVQAIPPEVSDFFMRMTRVMREADAFLRPWATATGLVKAQLFEEAQQWVERLQTLQGEINTRMAEAEAHLVNLDQEWVQARTAIIPRLLHIYHLFSYYGRWSSQIQEKLTHVAV